MNIILHDIDIITTSLILAGMLIAWAYLTNNKEMNERGYFYHYYPRKRN